jgi:signal recognition particle receptor subunit beta
MSAAPELKIVFTGPMGAGKTTAITVVSDEPPVSTEVGNNDRLAFAKDFTTVGLDFGELVFDDATRVRLYGTPGQERFSFMWEILGRGAIGIVFLLDASSPTWLNDLRMHAQVFHGVAPEQPFVVGIGRDDPASEDHVAACVKALADMGISAPVFSVDVRKREDVLLLIETLLAILEARTTQIS